MNQPLENCVNPWTSLALWLPIDNATLLSSQTPTHYVQDMINVSYLRQLARFNLLVINLCKHVQWCECVVLRKTHLELKHQTVIFLGEIWHGSLVVTVNESRPLLCFRDFPLFRKAEYTLFFIRTPFIRNTRLRFGSIFFAISETIWVRPKQSLPEWSPCS